MEKTVPIPEVYDAVLDREQLLSVIADIEVGTELLSVQVKQGRAAHSGEPSCGLRDATAALLAGSAQGMQVRYRYQGREFWDTLLRTPTGFRIVRIDHTAALRGE